MAASSGYISATPSQTSLSRPEKEIFTDVYMSEEEKEMALTLVYEVDEMGLHLKSAGVCVFSY